MMDGKTNGAKQEENDENMARDSRSQLILQFGQKGTFSIKQETEETEDRGCTDIQSQSNSCPVLPLTEGELLTTTEGKEERSQQQKGFQVYLIKQELKEEPSCHETENEKCQQQTSEGDLLEDNRQGPVEEERLQTSQPTSASGAKSFRDTHSTVQNSGNGKSFTENSHLSSNVSKRNLEEVKTQGGKCSQVDNALPPKTVTCSLDRYLSRPYRCTQCKHRFRNSSNLKQHMYIHLGEKPYECCKCEEVFFTQRDRNNHYKQSHRDVSVCECGEVFSGSEGFPFSSEVELVIHKKSHDMKNFHQCSRCQKLIPGDIDVSKLGAIHNTNRPYCSGYVKLLCSKSCHARMTGKQQKEKAREGLSKTKTDERCTEKRQVCSESEYKLVTGESSQEVCYRHDREFPTAFSSNERTEPNKDCCEFFNDESERVINTENDDTSTEHMRIGNGSEQNLELTETIGEECTRFNIGPLYSQTALSNKVKMETNQNESHMFIDPDDILRNTEDNSTCAEHIRTGNGSEHNIETIETIAGEECSEFSHLGTPANAALSSDIKIDPNENEDYGFIDTGDILRNSEDSETYSEDIRMGNESEQSIETRESIGEECNEFDNVGNSANVAMFTCSNKEIEPCENEGYRLIDPGEVLRNIEDNATYTEYKKTGNDNEQNIETRDTIGEECSGFNVLPNVQAALSSNKRMEQSENQDVSKSVKKPYLCPVCTYSFRDSADLKDHLYSHIGEKPYICSKCNKGFTRERTLKSHLAMIHGLNSSKKDLIIHNRVAEVEEMFQCYINKRLVKHHKCTVCDRVFTSQRLLKAHMRKKHKTTGTFPCFLCQEKFPTEQDWSGHMQLHTDQNPPNECYETSHESGDEAASTSVTNEAKLCNNGSETGIAESENEEAKQSNVASTSDMPRLISTKSVKKPYPCPVCNRRFRKSSHLKDHMFTHTGERPFVCPECLKGFTRRTFLISHFNQEHKDLFICECMETFSSEVELCMHKGSHSKANSYKCCKCEREFENRIALGTHFATHIENRYICSICKQTFGMNHQLLAHMKMHQMEGSHQGLSTDNDQRCTKNIELSTNANKTNLQETETKNGEGNQTNMYATYNLPILLGIKVLEKPYSCHVCKNGFSTKSSLKEHMYTHTTELPYKCSECAESFRRGSNLRHHYASKHADLNICDCGERFSSQLDLGIHKRTQINANPNICCKCGFECKNKAALNIHLTKHFVRRKGQLQALMERHKIEGTHCFLSKEISPLNRHRQQHISLHADENSSNMNLEDSFNSNPKLCYFTEHGSEGNREMNQTNLEARETREDKSNNALTHEIPRPQSENSAEKQHVCPVCNKRFRKSSHMKEHMYTHTGDKRFGCSQCKKRFTRNRALMHHLLKQHKDIPICECGEKFSSEAELISHQDTHECRTYAEKQLSCPVCNKIMRSNYRLKEHMYVHTREKPFECPQCGTRFTRRHGLLVHITHNHKHISTHKIREILTSQAQLLSQKQIHSHTSSGNVQETPDKHNEQCPTHEDCTKDIDTDPNRSLLDYSMGDSILPSINSHQRLNNIENGETCTEATEYGNNISEFNLEAERKESNMTSSSNSDILCGRQSEMSVKEEISCSKCHKQFATQQYLARHMNEHMLGHGYRCSECEMICGSKLDMSRHLRTHTGGRPHQCPECGIRFVTKLRMTQHMTRKHPPQALHLCNICGRRLRSQQSLLYHIKSHEREPCHKCPECGEGFRHKVDLSRHLVACTGGKPHQCPHCQERFGDKWEFNRHVKVHLGKGSRCTICNRECRTPWHLAGHMRRHYGEKPFECPQCKMRMVDKSSFNVHLRTHTGERPYKCFNCNKTFPTSSGRARHLRKVHKDFQVFRCDICDQRFSSRVDRISHKKKVFGEMPHQCLDCDQKFACMCDLTVHMRTHNG